MSLQVYTKVISKTQHKIVLLQIPQFTVLSIKIVILLLLTISIGLRSNSYSVKVQPLLVMNSSHSIQSRCVCGSFQCLMRILGCQREAGGCEFPPADVLSADTFSRGLFVGLSPFGLCKVALMRLRSANLISVIEESARVPFCSSSILSVLEYFCGLRV